MRIASLFVEYPQLSRVSPSLAQFSSTMRNKMASNVSSGVLMFREIWEGIWVTNGSLLGGVGQLLPVVQNISNRPAPAHLGWDKCKLQQAHNSPLSLT